ncbi:hypothetical protein CAF53_10365 [Sphingobium sp. LB126]|nr:hypothetical protein CAF53_10365 [Sphingobium sp. LB126]
MPSKSHLSSAVSYVRYYASVLLGNEAHVQELIERAVGEVENRPQSYKAWDVRQALFVAFHEQLATREMCEPSAVPEGRNDAAIRRLQRMDLLTRSATLLQALGGYKPDEISVILGIEGKEAARLAGEGLAELRLQEPTTVVIIEDHPVISAHLHQIVTDMGHEVSAIVTTRHEAVAAVRAKRPGLILVDIELEDGSSGVDAVNEIFLERQYPTIFVTAFPERLLTDKRPQPTYLVTKPFRPAIVQNAIAQALLSAQFDEPEAEDTIARLPVILPQEIDPIDGPIGAEVAGGKLRLVDATIAQTKVSPDSLDELRQDHLATAMRLCRNLEGSNVGPGFSARLETVRKTLNKPLSAERGLQLAIQSRGLEMMMPQITERLDDVTAADVGALVSDLVALSRQFPTVRQFLEEARAIEGAGERAHDAAVQLADVIIDQPPSLVEPDLKEALLDLRTAAADGREPLAELGLIRAVGNILRAIGRALSRRVSGIKSSAAKSFDDTLGETLGKGLADQLRSSALPPFVHAGHRGSAVWAAGEAGQDIGERSLCPSTSNGGGLPVLHRADGQPIVLADDSGVGVNDRLFQYAGALALDIFDAAGDQRSDDGRVAEQLGDGRAVPHLPAPKDRDAFNVERLGYLMLPDTL